MSTAYAPTIDNLLIEQGTTFARRYPVSGVNLSGATVKAQARLTYVSEDVLIEFTATVTADEDDETTGYVQISLTDEDTAALDFEHAVWDALLTSGDDPAVKSRVARGYVEFSPGVTRDD